MSKLFAFVAVLTVCAGPAFARADRPDPDCGDGPETTGSLVADPRSLRLPGGRGPEWVEVTPPEESWQAEFQRNAEQRRRDALACGVD